MEKISNDYRENVRVLDGLLGVGRSCDMVSRDYLIGGRRARLWVVDGFGSDSILERMGAFWLTLKPENVVGLTEMQDFLDRYITFSESNVTFDISDAVTSVFLGKSLLAVEGLAGVALMDAKGYPSRSVHEPPDGKVLRGSHDGFVEAVVPNMALLRRRIRDPHLTMEGHKVGSRTHNDAVLCYLDDKVDQDLLRKLRGKLLGLDVRSLTMAQESLAEAIRPKQWYNPFPKVRYTERPDAAAASIMEGSIVLMVDNSPSVMILPTGFFDFTQESNDYYFPPLVGTYLRVLRVTVFLLSLFITPAWYLMVSEPNRLPGWLNFLSSPEPVSLSLLSQLLVVEFLIDVLKLASLNTPDSLSNSFSMLGAFIARNNYFDLLIALAVGLVAFGFRLGNFPLAPALVSFILAPQFEYRYSQVAIYRADTPWPVYLADHPLACIFLVVVLFLLIRPVVKSVRKWREVLSHHNAP